MWVTEEGGGGVDPSYFVAVSVSVCVEAEDETSFVLYLAAKPHAFKLDSFRKINIILIGLYYCSQKRRYIITVLCVFRAKPQRQIDSFQKINIILIVLYYYSPKEDILM